MFHVLIPEYRQPVDVIEQTRPAHLEWVQGEVDAGRIILGGRQDPPKGGLFVTADISVEAAEDIIERDPYQIAGLVSYRRISFNGAFRAPEL